LTKKPAIGLLLPWDRMMEISCGIEAGITIVAARPGVGKSTFESQVAVCAASAGKRVARFALEMTRDQLLQRDMCRIAGVSLPKLKFGNAGRSQIAQVGDAAKELAALRMHIDDRTRDVSQIASKCRNLAAREGLDLITIDYVGLMTHVAMGDAQWNANARLTEISAALKNLTAELKAPVLLLSQLSRPPKDPRRKTFTKAPELSDLRDSGSLEQDCEKCFFLYQHEEVAEQMEEAAPGSSRRMRPVWLDLAKHRNGETGRRAFWQWCKYFKFEDTGCEKHEDWERHVPKGRRSGGNAVVPEPGIVEVTEADFEVEE
jgi:replicative DNA helicase